MLRFFHRPLMVAKLSEYEYKIKNKRLSTIEYKIKAILRKETKEKIDNIKVWHTSIHTPKLTLCGFQALAVYIPKYEEILIIFRGSEMDDISDWYYNYTGIVSGENTSQLESALSFIKYLKNNIINFNNCYKIGAGHSLGGNLIITTQLLKKDLQHIYTYNTALPQLQQLRKFDKKFDEELHNYFLDVDINESGRLEKFTENYYSQYSHHIYNYIIKNDFINSLNTTIGTFNIGKIIEFPPILKTYIDPEKFLTTDDAYQLEKILGGFHNYLKIKGINNYNLVENQKLVGEEFISYIINCVKFPIEKQGLLIKSSKEKINQSYKYFKAIYSYILYLAHSGIIPKDIVMIDEKDIPTLYEKIIKKDIYDGMNELIKPIKNFYKLIIAVKYLLKVKEFKDLEGWVKVAKAHDLSSFYNYLNNYE